MNDSPTSGLSNRKRDERPWGSFEQFTENEISTVKIIFVKAGEAFSLQTHADRDEFWHILSGSGTVTVGNSVKETHAPNEFFIARKTAHRAEGGPEGLRFLEISFGKFDENDIVRLEDKYGRT